jgi:predicted permease
MLADLRFAARLLRKTPHFTAGAVALLACGVAANAVVFSLADALLLRPLPVREPEQLVRLAVIRPPLAVTSNFPETGYEAWKKGVSGFEDVLAWSEADMYAATDIAVAAERLLVHFVTDTFFDALGTAPAFGRLLTPGDHRPDLGVAPVVLSYPYWKRRFAGDAGVVGKTIALDGRKVMIVGVSAKGFNGLQVETGPDLRAPLRWHKILSPEADDYELGLAVAARLRADASMEAARQEAEAIWRNAGDTTPAERFVLEPAARGISRMRAQFSGVLWLLMGGVALLMTLVCANLAGLLMARTAGRRGELAVRRALGASRYRLARQLFSEALLLMLAGAAGAVALTYAAVPYMANALPPVRDSWATRLTVTLDLSPDWRVLGFAIAVSAGAVVLFGLAPALTGARLDLHPLLKEARSGGGRGGRNALVAFQAALCTVLLAGAGLTVLTLQQLQGTDPGFDSDRVVTLTVDPAMAKYTAAQTAELQRRLLEGARAMPEVESAALAVRGLMRGTGVKATVARSGEGVGPEEFLNTSVHGVSPEYFAVMRIPWIAGWNFTGREDPKATPKPVIVNQAFVKRFGAGREVIGGRFGAVPPNGTPAAPLFEVVGTVGDARYRSLREPFHPTLYHLAAPGDTHTWQSFIVHLRTRSAPESVINPMRRLLAGIDPRLSYVEVDTLANEVSASLWAERVAAFLATAFAAAAALIAGAGLYALVGFAMMQRRREIGIRVALGALPRDIVMLLFARAAWISAAGIACGIAAAWALAPRIAPLLYEVAPRELSVLAAAAVSAFAVTAAAALIPSLRAARLHPASVLRQE